jgi:hypothetical protein
MARILEIDHILKPSPDYPIKNILVDTNIIINYENLFGNINPKLNSKTFEILNKLKSSYNVNSTLVTAIEYYKFIQVGFYQIFTRLHPKYSNKYTTQDFKKLKRRDSDFLEGWNLRVKTFKRTFKKHFPTYDIQDDTIYNLDLIENFDGVNVDFGDELLYQYAIKTDFPLIITSDRDLNLSLIH